MWKLARGTSTNFSLPYAAAISQSVASLRLERCPIYLDDSASEHSASIGPLMIIYVVRDYSVSNESPHKIFHWRHWNPWNISFLNFINAFNDVSAGESPELPGQSKAQADGKDACEMGNPPGCHRRRHQLWLRTPLLWPGKKQSSKLPNSPGLVELPHCNCLISEIITDKIRFWSLLYQWEFWAW